MMKIADIAKAAGVSIGTVDRVIHDRGRVSKETREKIEKIIEDSGYTPNIMASNLKKGTTITIGVLIPLLSSEGGYWQKIYDGMLKAMAEVSHFSISLKIREFDRTRAGDALEKGKELIAQGISVLAIAPVVQADTYSLITELGSTPYAFFDSPLPDTRPIIENLQDPYRAGFCAGRLMELFRPHARKFICLQMHTTAYNLQQRALGFTDYFAGKEIEIVNIIWDYTPEDQKFFTFFDSVLADHPDAAGYFVTNDTTGTIAYYLKRKYPESMPVIIGFDLLEHNIQGLQEGLISVLLSQQPEVQGYNTIIEIFRSLLLNQQETIRSSPIPIDIIFKENLPQQ
jgi:LacI family transcriptional regulator